MLGKGPAGQHLVSSVRGSWDMVGVAVYGDANCPTGGACDSGHCAFTSPSAEVAADC
jgi:hypothetical protein